MRIQFENKGTKFLCYRCDSNKPCIFINPDTDDIPIKCPLDVGETNWIKEKSEFQQKVEEAEDMYKDFDSLVRKGNMITDKNYIIDKFYKVIQLFKEKYSEEFK